MNFVPATITRDEKGDFSLPIVCHFAPEQITIVKTNSWAPQQPAQGHKLSPPQFSSARPSTLRIKLWLDATEIPGRDVKGDADKLLQLMTPQVKQDLPPPAPSATPPKAGVRAKPPAPQMRPPILRFQWGALLSFRCVLQRATVVFNLFNPAGTPLRATVDCTFNQVASDDDFPGQNPTSGGRTGERIHRLAPRETLDQVAYWSFGSTSLWRAIAAFNGIDDPLRLTAGDTILLPASADDLTEA
jgi:Contractile injection system tube protein